jgi:hypothetical protein
MSLERAWTVAEDDMLCQRPTVCFVCGLRAECLDLYTLGEHAWCIGRCRHCAAADPQGLQVAARLVARGAT